MKKVEIFGKTIPIWAVITVIVVIGVAAATIYTSLSFGPTVVTEEPNPQLSSTYNDVVGSTATVGTTYEFTVTTSNPTDALDLEGVIEPFTITDDSDDSIAPDDITLEHNTGTEAEPTWTELILEVNEGGDTLTYTFGDSDGYSIPAGESIHADLRITFNTVGTYSGELTIEDAAE